MAYPTAFRWTNGPMVPTHPRLAASRFEEGETYLLNVYQERSRVSHSHEFAFIAEAHKTFSEELVERFPTPDHLRAHALIRGGFANIEDHICETKAEAQRWRARLQSKGEYSVVIIPTGTTAVRVLTPKSQSYRAMDKAEFQASKTAIMEFIAELLGVAPGDLPEREAA
jgi:hypothetical protein